MCLRVCVCMCTLNEHKCIHTPVHTCAHTRMYLLCLDTLLLQFLLLSHTHTLTHTHAHNQKVSILLEYLLLAYGDLSLHVCVCMSVYDTSVNFILSRRRTAGDWHIHTHTHKHTHTHMYILISVWSFLVSVQQTHQGNMHRPHRILRCTCTPCVVSITAARSLTCICVCVWVIDLRNKSHT